MPLYIGANYHPHDWPAERWPVDVALMKQAGFTTVRLGHLCWDSYEPEDGVYTFGWFDRVMDLFAEAGIGVFLDIPVRPAPRWVHKLCPGCDIATKGGTRQDSLTRYMEDVDDPAYQHYALRFARVLVERYKGHPALFAFGLCNELGSGFLSFSEGARQRFVGWLKKKYGTLEALNAAWATQRWSRRLTSFDDVVLQENDLSRGAPEAWLDMRRFFADGIGDFLASLKNLVADIAPGVPHSSNHYSDHPRSGFDYLKEADRFVDYPGIGAYPECMPNGGQGARWLIPIYMLRLAETGRPMWGLEFITGSTGVYAPPRGVNRMWIFYFLLHRAEMFLGWTFRTMLGGEEQYLFGMLDHDGTPTRIYDEYACTATDLQKLSAYAFPYLPKPDIAVSFSHDSDLLSGYHARQYRLPHMAALANALAALEGQGRDYNIVDLRNMKEPYRLLIIPGQHLLEGAAIENVRRFVQEGGTVIMTGYSAWIDETGKVFSTPKPGGLADVFGIRVAGFGRTDVYEPDCQDRVVETPDGKRREVLTVQRGDAQLPLHIDYYEHLQLQGATSFATFAGKELCAISAHAYGKGTAYYVAAETNERLLDWLLEELAPEIGLEPPLQTPPGVCGRRLTQGQHFYVNLTEQTVDIPLPAEGTGVLSGIRYTDHLSLPPYEGELVVSDGL